MLKIDKVEAIAISIPLTRDFGGSTYHVTRRCTVVTRIYAGGLVSEVYNGDNRDHQAKTKGYGPQEERLYPSPELVDFEVCSIND